MFGRASIPHFQANDDLTVETGQSTAPSTVGTESNFGTFSSINVMDVEDDTSTNKNNQPRSAEVPPFKAEKKDTLSLSLLPLHDVIGTFSTLSTTQVCVSILASEVSHDDNERAAVDIIVAQDVSGSMSGNELKLCKKTLEMLLGELGPRDRFGLICYESTARIEIPACSMTYHNKVKALRKIKEIHADGGTNISAGLFLASQEMQSIEEPNQVRSIFLLTDGHSNQGITDKTGLVSLVKSFETNNQGSKGDSPAPVPDVSGGPRAFVRQDLKDCAARKGKCIFCHETQTHERVGRCFWKQWKPTTEVNEKGVTTVYKGHCLKPGCYDLTSVKINLGEPCNLTPSDFNDLPNTITVDSMTPSLSNGLPKTVSVDTGYSPVSIHCFGYGTSHDSSVLQAIAGASPGGTYYFIESFSNVLSAFGDAMGGVLSVVAQSAVINLTVPPSAMAKGVKIVKVHHDKAIARPNGSYTVAIGDFYAGETRDVLLELQLAKIGLDGSSEEIPHVRVTLDYMDTILKAARNAGPPLVCAIARPPDKALSDANTHVSTQWLRVFAAREMKLADEEAGRQELETARTRLKAAKATIMDAPLPVRASPIVTALVLDIDLITSGFQSSEKYNSYGSHWSKNKTMTHSKQRCSDSVEGSFNAYRSKTKGTISQRFNSKST